VKQSTNLQKRKKNDGLLKDYKPLNRLIFNKSEGLKDFLYQTESRSFFRQKLVRKKDRPFSIYPFALSPAKALQKKEDALMHTLTIFMMIPNHFTSITK
jgi:hypothetical protein